MTELILASASPRRRQMLADLGIPFRVIVSEADETCCEPDPEMYALAVSRKKAEAVQAIAPKGSIVIACDTVVAHKGMILGKPADRDEAKQMLKMLSGQEHRVISALCLTDGNKTVQKAVTTYVTFRNISEEEIATYVATGECDDKAGAYGIQGLGGLFVSGICGDWYTVVGMPLATLNDILKKEFSLDLFVLRQKNKE